MSDALQQFKDANWQEICPKLASYALSEVKKLHWRTPRDSLPEGKTAEDLASGAIRKTYEGLLTDEQGKGLRKWDPGRVPDLLYFLERTVDSDLNDLVNRQEHRDTNYSANLQDEDAAAQLEQSIDAEANPDEVVRARDPEQRLADAQESRVIEQRYKALMSSLYTACADNDEEAMVLLAMEEIIDADEDVTPKMIEEKTGLNYDKIKNIRKRISRKAEDARKLIMSQEGGGK